MRAFQRPSLPRPRNRTAVSDLACRSRSCKVKTVVVVARPPVRDRQIRGRGRATTQSGLGGLMDGAAGSAFWRRSGGIDPKLTKSLTAPTSGIREIDEGL
jgi:hypothetical protein